MVTLVCCYNNLEQYENLQKSLSYQTVEYELVGIDNMNGEYQSAASALNVGGVKRTVNC